MCSGPGNGWATTLNSLTDCKTVARRVAELGEMGRIKRHRKLSGSDGEGREAYFLPY